MHPAPSIILFTSLSGLGFGLLFFLGLGMPGVTGWVAFAFFAITQFLLNGLHLLIQIIFALGALHLRLHARFDLLFDLQDGHFPLHQAEHLFEPL